MGQATYERNSLDYIQLFDIRGRELIDNKATDSEHPWVIGNGENGFGFVAPEIGVSAGDVFSLGKVTYEPFVHDAKGMGVNFLDNHLTAEGSKLIFKNMNNLKLQDDIYVTVTVSVEYPWGTQTYPIKYTVTSKKVESEPTTPDAE